MKIIINVRPKETFNARQLAEKIIRLQASPVNLPLIDNDEVYLHGKRLLEMNYKAALSALIEAKPKQAILFDDIANPRNVKRAEGLIDDYRLATGITPLCICILHGE